MNTTSSNFGVSNNASLGGLMSGGPRVAPFGGVSARAQQSIEEQDSFASVLSRAGISPSKKDQSPQDKAREAAQQLVSTALVQPILKQLRENNNAAEPFKPNSAEKSFGQMMDAQLSQRIVTAKGWALVDRVADRLLQKAGLPKVNEQPMKGIAS